MHFIPIDDVDDGDGEGKTRGLVRQERSWEPIGDLDRSYFDAWRAFDEVEIPTAELCISFQGEEDSSEAEGVPRMWSLPPNS